uniref:DUF4780 domain-containing protein n=1 Tax=Haemonchus contortus TaxID=6289 RepID=A0A7I4XWY5_HAECO
MLGKNLGRKVGPEFINKEYHDYLKQQVKQSHKPVKEEKSASVGSETPRSASPKVEPVPPQGQKARMQRKREEMRKRGIFVQADSVEDLPTVFEKTEVQFRPYICPAVNRKLRWKKKLDKHPRKKSMQKKARRESKEKEQGIQSPKVPSPEQSSRTSDETTTTTEATTTTEEQPTKTQDAANFPPAHKEESEIRVSRKNPKKYKREEDVFAAIDEDVDLKKVLEDFDLNRIQNVGQEDKHTLDGARKILQVAFRDKESEKILTSYENDVIVKLFSGKIPFDANVLKVVDSVLDKTIDYFKTKKTQLDPEIQQLIERRNTLKAAMLHTMLTTPSFIPTSWVKQYEVYRQEAEKETTGINWAKILLLYPRQRSFDDGAADVFGNFTRARRGHWLWGCIFGPNDSKSFDEVDREKKSQSLFVDTAIIASARMEVKPNNSRDDKNNGP